MRRIPKSQAEAPTAKIVDLFDALKKVVSPGIRTSSFRVTHVPIRAARPVRTILADDPVWDARDPKPLPASVIAKVIVPAEMLQEGADVQRVVEALRRDGAVLRVEGARVKREARTTTPKPAETLRAVVRRVAGEVETQDRTALVALMDAVCDEAGL